MWEVEVEDSILNRGAPGGVFVGAERERERERGWRLTGLAAELRVRVADEQGQANQLSRRLSAELVCP